MYQKPDVSIDKVTNVYGKYNALDIFSCNVFAFINHGHVNIRKSSACGIAGRVDLHHAHVKSICHHIVWYFPVFEVFKMGCRYNTLP